MENFNSKSPRQRQVEYLKGLYNQVEKASPNKDGLYHFLVQFCNFCLNLKLNNSFSGVYGIEGITFDENLKKELLTNIKMVIAVSESRQSSYSPTLNISNTNQQSQVLNNSIIVEAMRKGLTGEQYDELMELIKSKADKKSIKDKILEYGKDVTAGILSSIISSLMI